MRRGKINNLALVFLILGSIFTLFSFIFDQMVIQKEDQIRNLSSEYEQAFNNYTASKNVIVNTLELSNRIMLKKIKYDFQADFLQEAIMSIKFSPQIYDDYFHGGKGSNYNKNLETIFIGKYLSMYIKVLNESTKANDFLWSLPIRAMDNKKFKKENQQVMQHMLVADKLLVENLKKYRNIGMSFKINDIKTIEDFNKMRKNFTDLLNNFSASATEVTSINKIYGSFMNLYFLKSQKLVLDKSRTQNARNIFILLSVVSQILGLLFLILLFKSLINKQKKTITA